MTTDRVWRFFTGMTLPALGAIGAAVGVLCFFGFDLAGVAPRLVLREDASLSFHSTDAPLVHLITVAVAYALVPMFAWGAGSLRGFFRGTPVGVVEALPILALVIVAAFAGAAIWILVARHLFDFGDSGIKPMVAIDSFVEWRWALGGAAIAAIVIALRDYARIGDTLYPEESNQFSRLKTDLTTSITVHQE
jgi:hypothetical protein